ncbi:helix-turn-helix transcriptional regulator, partial [Roseobacter sp.]|uniref:helix-turn-helix domain-containing protein n=1 Tax=Roseobacter sp. TaxID=1907202 RepID=UPI0038588A8D
IIYPKDSALSPREAECLLWLAKGDRNAEIARRLGVNSKTVDFHLAGARQKLNAKTSTEAVVIAVINRYIQP